MKHQEFTDLIIWQEAIKLYEEISSMIEKSNFKKYFFIDQVLRASLSVSNNIAEGFERSSKKELIRFLYIAKGSCAEVRSMLLQAQKLGYFDEKETKKREGDAKKLGILIGRYIRAIYSNS